MLLSGGGNDTAGPELAMLVKHKNSALAQKGEFLRPGAVDFISTAALKGASQRAIETSLEAAEAAGIGSPRSSAMAMISRSRKDER